jgi:hypothetical protein
MAMGAIANGGILMRPQILDHLEDDLGRYAYEQIPQPVRRVYERKEWPKRLFMLLRRLLKRLKHIPVLPGVPTCEIPTQLAGKLELHKKAAPGAVDTIPTSTMPLLWASSLRVTR